MIMQGLHEAESSFYLSYIGTEDGVLAVWPYSDKTLSNTAPFNYKDMPYYSQARQKKKTIWTGPYMDGKGNPAITITTPIFRGDEFAGIAGMDVSLYPIYNDLTSMRGRGYPFIIDASGLTIYRPKNKPEGGINEIFEADNLLESTSLEVRASWQGRAERKLRFYCCWSGGYRRICGFLAHNYPWLDPLHCLPRRGDESAGEIHRFRHQGRCQERNQGLNDASRRVRDYALAIFVLTLFCVLGAGWWLSGRIEGQIASLVGAAEKISRGEFDVQANTSGELAF